MTTGDGTLPDRTETEGDGDEDEDEAEAKRASPADAMNANGWAGLCASCKYGRVVQGAHSAFSLCELSQTNPAFAKYPTLPVWRCPGYALVFLERVRME